MIIKRMWITIKGQGFRRVERHWRGWFLFGIIPLYISNEYIKLGL
jgi:hypothetical protein